MHITLVYETTVHFFYYFSLKKQALFYSVRTYIIFCLHCLADYYKSWVFSICDTKKIFYNGFLKKYHALSFFRFLDAWFCVEKSDDDAICTCPFGDLYAAVSLVWYSFSQACCCCCCCYFIIIFSYSFNLLFLEQRKKNMKENNILSSFEKKVKTIFFLFHSPKNETTTRGMDKIILLARTRRVEEYVKNIIRENISTGKKLYYFCGFFVCFA